MSVKNRQAPTKERPRSLDAAAALPNKARQAHRGFALSLCNAALFLCVVFAMGGIGGWIYEMFFYRLALGEFIKRGQGVGPWLPIYAFGAWLLLAATVRMRKKWLVFLAGALILGAFECLSGFLLLRLGGLRLWNYNEERWNFGNVGGFICLRSVLMFGVLGSIARFGIYPAAKRICTRTRLALRPILLVLLAGLLTADMGAAYVKRPFLACGLPLPLCIASGVVLPLLLLAGAALLLCAVTLYREREKK